MIKYFLTFSTLTLAFSWTIMTQNQCVCSQLSEQLCTIGRGCQWNQNQGSCKNYVCETITDSLTCNQIPYCYQNGSCINFTNCQSVPYSSQLTCNQVHGCQYYTGGTCSGFQCAYQSSQAACTKYWQCIYTGQSCTQAMSCSQYNEFCPIGQYCQMNDLHACVPATCSSLSINSCTFVYTSLDGIQIQPCIIDGNQCVVANYPSQFNTENICLTNTNDLYYWYQEAGSGNGKCVACIVTNPSFNSILISFAMAILWIL